MENQINLKEKTSEELGLMLGETAMSMNQLHQNYLAIAAEIRSRMPQVQVSNNLQENSQNT